MAQDFSVGHFFRRMPNALLARYFHGKGLFAELDFAAMKETKPDALLQAWAELPDSIRDICESELRTVHDLCDERGWRALQDAAREVLQDDESAAFVAKLAALEDHAAQAMTAFLDHHSLWMLADRYHHADGLARWKKLQGLAQVDLTDIEATCNALSEAIRAYFLKEEHRGRNCTVEHYRRGAKDYFFAYPRDHASEALEWVKDDMTRRPHSPAFELIFVYEKARGSLDLSCRNAPRAVRPLQEIFAKVVLGQEALSASTKDGRPYDLAPLLDAGFQFTRGSDSGIADVQLKKLRLTRRWQKGEHITLQAANTAALHQLLGQVRESLALADFHVTQAEVWAQVWEPGRRAPRPVTFTVGWPNACSLKHEGAHEALRKMLQASRIEPQAQAVAGEVGQG
jgi:hypothetical protein